MWGREELELDPDTKLPFGSLVRDYQKAQAVFERKCITVIEDAAPNNWQAAAWLLERTRPDRYGKVDRYRGVKHQDEQGGPPLQSRKEGQQKLLLKLADLAALALERVPVDEHEILEGEVVQDEEEDEDQA